MFCYIKVSDDKTAAVDFHSGLGDGADIKFAGATFPVVPTGTFVEKVSMKVPDGLHSLAFFCRFDGPQRRGSGKTAHLDYTPHRSSVVLLSWLEGDKLILKADKDMSSAELAQFNAFVRSDVDVLVVDTDRKIAFHSTVLPRDSTVDPAWTYKSVAMDAILEYITKKLTIAELDQRATSDQEARDELRRLRDEVSRLSADLSDLEIDYRTLQDVGMKVGRTLTQLSATLKKSERLHNLLKRLPTKLLPVMFAGFVKAMDSLNQHETATDKHTG